MTIKRCTNILEEGVKIMNALFNGLNDYKLYSKEISGIEKTATDGYEITVSDMYNDFTLILTENEYSEILIKKLSIYSKGEININSKICEVLRFLHEKKLNFNFKVELTHGDSSLQCHLKNIEFVPKKLINANLISKNVNDLNQLSFMLLDDGRYEGETYMLSEMIGLKGDGDDAITLFFKINYIVTQNGGTIYKDVIYTEEYTIDGIRRLFANYIYEDVDSVINLIGRTFVLYVGYLAEVPEMIMNPEYG